MKKLVSPTFCKAIITCQIFYHPKKHDGLSAYGGSGTCSISNSTARCFILRCYVGTKLYMFTFLINQYVSYSKGQGRHLLFRRRPAFLQNYSFMFSTAKKYSR